MQCPLCGHLLIEDDTQRTPSKLVWKCPRCGYEEETIYPSCYDNGKEE